MQNQQQLTGFSTMSSAIEFADNYNNWILDIFKPYIKENILEIGTGQGNFRKYFPNNKDYISIDIDEEVIKRASQRDPNGLYFVADISEETCISKLKSYNCDTILCTNVLEHIKQDQKAINNMIEVLKPGGYLLLFIPAFASLYSSMDQLAGHYRRYTKQEIASLFTQTNIKIVKNEYFNFIGGIGWWANKFFSHQDLDNKSINTQIKFFDKYVVPISKLINPLTKSLFGQSLICIVYKEVL